MTRIERIETIRLAEHPRTLWVQVYTDDGQVGLGAAPIVMPDIIWTGGISEAKKIATLAEAYHLPIAPHDCTGPVNVFACLHLCASAPNAQFMENVRAFYRGYYADIVEPNFEIADGHISFPTAPGLGTRLRPEVRQRADATVQSSGHTAVEPTRRTRSSSRSRHLA